MTTQNVFPVEGDDPAIPAIDASRNASLAVKKEKLYVPDFALSVLETISKSLKNLKTGFQATFNGNNYRFDTSNQDRNNNLNYLIDLTFKKVNNYL